MDNVRADFTINNQPPIEAEFSLGVSQHFDCSFELFAAGAIWGTIEGILSNQTDLQDALDAKQDVLTAGDNISIENNVVSATYTAGEGIDITDGVISNTRNSAEWGNITGTLSDQTDLQDALDGLSGDISDINNTIESFGDIVTYNAADFATAAQGALADTALQPGDNISELVNDEGYITGVAWGDITGTLSNQTDLQDALDAKVTNNATGTKALAVGNTSQSTAEGGVAVGYGARANSTYATAIGEEARANNTNTTVIGKAAKATEARAIAIGSGAEANAQDAIAIKGINNTANTFQVYTYNMLDMSTGLIPDARISSNIARTTDIPSLTNYVTTNTAQTISADKAFSQPVVVADNVGLASGTLLSSKKILQRKSSDNSLQLNNKDNKLRLVGNETRPKYSTDETNYADLALYSDVEAIDELIPSQATTSNQLADKAFVNSSVQTASANFRGNWADWAAVPSVATDYPVDYAGNKTPTVNDYLVVQDASDYTLDTLEGTWRFKYSGEWDTDGKAGWLPEYQVNETPLSAAQLAALNSGITAADVTLIGTALQPNDNVSELNNDAGYITSASLPTVNDATLTIQKNGTDVATFTANSATNQTANITVPTDTSDLTNNAGYITGIDSTDITTALGYTPVNPSSLATVATSGSYNDLSNTPTVGDGTITFTQGGVTKGTITTNQSGDTTIALDAGSVTDVQVDGVSVLDGTVAKIDLSGKQDVLSSANAGTDISISKPIVIKTETGNGSVTFTAAENAELTAVTLTGGTAQNTIPKGYKQVASLESDGTASLATPFIVANVAKVEGTVSFTKLTTGYNIQYVVGGRTSSSATATGVGYCLYSPAKGGLTFYPMAWRDTSIGTDVTIGTQYAFSSKIVTGDQKLIVNDIEKAALTYTITKSSGTNTIALFALGTTGSQYTGDGVVLHDKIIFYDNNDNIMAYYVFVERESDNALGALDLVNGTFITNASGTFTKGAYVTNTTYPVQVVPTPTNSVDITCNNGAIGLAEDIFNPSVITWSTSSVIVYSPIFVGNGTFTLSTSDYLDDSTYTNMFFLAGSVSSGANSTNNGVYKGKTVSQTAVDGYVTIATRATVSGRDLGDPKDYTWYLRKTDDYIVTGTTETVTDSLINSATVENLLYLNDTYKDTQEVLTGTVTRKCKVVVFDGTENWSAANNACYTSIGISGIPFEGLTAYCTHFTYDNTKHSTSTIANNTFIFNQSVGQTGTNGTVTIKATSLFTSAATVKSWLAQQYANGTPVIMVVPIAEETTETVTAQNLNIQEGSNTFTITQASIANLPLSVTYQEGSEDVVISFSNDTGYITGIDSSDVTTALGYTPYDSANPNGYTSNTGTVTSVNNVSPVSGDVTLTASDVGAEPTLGYTPVNKAGDTMTGILKIQRDSGNEFLQIYPNVILTTPPASTRNLAMFVNYDTNNKVMAKAMQVLASDGSNSVKLSAFHPDGIGSVAGMEAGWDSNGIAYATVPSTSSSRNNATDIITRDYLTSQLSGKENALGYTPVNKAGDTMTGDLTISKDSTANLSIKRSDITRATAASSDAGVSYLIFSDTNDDTLGQVAIERYTDGRNTIKLQAFSADGTAAPAMRVNAYADNSVDCSFPRTNCCDGQWVNSSQTLISSGTSLNGSTSLNYRIDLPNDGQKYEVMLRGQCFSGSTAGNDVLLGVNGNQDSYSRHICRARAGAAGTYAGAGTVIVTASYVASGSTNLTVSRSTSYNGSCSELTVIAYRRIGTNT